MPFLKFPLRLVNGFLNRMDEPEAMLGLVRAMAMTPQGSWPGCPLFGVRDLLERAMRQPMDMDPVLREINRAFLDLGITGYQLQALEMEEGSRVDAGIFTATLERTGSKIASWSTRLEALD